LKVLWQAMSVVHYDPMIQKMAEYAYDALYEKLDVALYGYPVRKCPPSVADAIPCDEQTGGGE